MDDNLFPEILRRDMLGESCLVCKIGTYKETFRQNSLVKCNRCYFLASRWMSKREKLAYMQEVLSED